MLKVNLALDGSTELDTVKKSHSYPLVGKFLPCQNGLILCILNFLETGQVPHLHVMAVLGNSHGKRHLVHVRLQSTLIA